MQYFWPLACLTLPCEFIDTLVRFWKSLVGEVGYGQDCCSRYVPDQLWRGGVVEPSGKLDGLRQNWMTTVLVLVRLCWRWGVSEECHGLSAWLLNMGCLPFTMVMYLCMQHCPCHLAISLCKLGISKILLPHSPTGPNHPFISPPFPPKGTYTLVFHTHSAAQWISWHIWVI